MDVDRCAGANGRRWVELADEAIGAAPLGASFREACDVSRIGTNVIATKLARFLADASLDSTYAVEAARSNPADAYRFVYEEELWGPKRLAVEVALDGLRTTVYGTLDLPGAPGDSTYGPFRLVYEPLPTTRPPVVLPHNSAAAYVASGVIDEAALCADAAAWEHRGPLAVAALGPSAARRPFYQWPKLLASEHPASAIEHDVIEVVVRDGKRPLASVDAVRIVEADFDAVIDTYLRTLLLTGGIELSELELATVQVAEAVIAGRLELELL